MPQLGFVEHQLEVALSHGPYQISQTWHAYSWSRHQLTCSQVPDWYLIGRGGGYLKLKTRVNSNSKISRLALAQKIWHIFHGRNLHTQLCCSSHKCMFLTNVAPFKREINRLSNSIRFIAKKHSYNKEMIYQTQISLLFMLCSYFIFIFFKSFSPLWAFNFEFLSTGIKKMP